MKVSKVSENIIKDFKNERFDEIRRNIGDDITNDGIFPDLQVSIYLSFFTLFFIV